MQTKGPQSVRLGLIPVWSETDWDGEWHANRWPHEAPSRLRSMRNIFILCSDPSCSACCTWANRGGISKVTRQHRDWRDRGRGHCGFFNKNCICSPPTVLALSLKESTCPPATCVSSSTPSYEHCHFYLFSLCSQCASLSIAVPVSVTSNLSVCTIIKYQHVN